MRPRLAIVLPAFCLAVLPAHSQEMSATLGKQRAAGSRIEWEVRDAGHPALGNIRYAFIKKSVETPVGNAKVFSRAYLSCQREARKFAIELANATAPDDPSGLQPSTLPKLTCNRPTADGKLVQEELLANWDVSAIGDTLAKGFRAFPLRECVSIGVVQEVILPPGWAQKTARIEFEIAPYNRDVDSIFVACGERSAYAPAGPVAPAAAAIASAPAAHPTPSAPVTAPAPPPPAAPATPPAAARASDAPWREARVLANGKTNVRAGPTLKSAVVVRLYPGEVVLVQGTGSEWWRARASGRAKFEGYIREDRLVFKK